MTLKDLLFAKLIKGLNITENEFLAVGEAYKKNLSTCLLIAETENSEEICNYLVSQILPITNNTLTINWWLEIVFCKQSVTP